MNCCNNCDTLGVAIGEKGNDGSMIGAIVKKIIPSINILTLNTIPIQLIPSPGTGTAIKIIEWSSYIQFNSLPYATNTILQIFTKTATLIQGRDNKILLSTVSRMVNGQLIYTTSTTDTQIIANQPLMLNTLTGNPTIGNSDLIIYIGYSIIKL